MLLEEIIPDANALFSFFKTESTRRNVFRELLKHKCKFSAPDKLFEELSSNKSSIIKSAHISEFDFSYLYKLLADEVMSFSEEQYKIFLSEAERISPHEKDIPYFALALSLKIPIWSDEKLFKKQLKVEIFSTSDLLKLLSNE